MAELSGNVLGKLSGKIGNITARIRNGKNYLASRPGSFIPGSDPASVARRNKFRAAVKFSKTIITVDDLKKIWIDQKSSDISAFNYVVKVNYNHIVDGKPSSSNLITPPVGFNATFSNITLNSDSINLTLDPLSGVPGIDTGIETEVKICAVLCLSAPVTDVFDDFNLASLQSDPITLQTLDPTVFNLPLSIASGFLDNYSSKVFYITALTLDNNGEVVHFSNTFYHQFQ